MAYYNNRMDSEYRADAEVGLFLKRELEKILTRTFEVQYPELKYSRLVPISTEVGNGNDSFTYRIYDSTGRMKPIADRSQDLPRVDILRKEVTHKVVSFGASFGYSVQETRAALVANIELEQRKANALRRSYEETANSVCYFGDSAHGIEGFFNNANVSKLVVTGGWLDDVAATSDDMLAILNEGVTRIVQNSKMREVPDTILVPYTVYRKLSTTPRSSTSDTTVLTYFLGTNPYITSIEPVNELEYGNSGGGLSKDRVIIYRRDPDKVQFHIPQTLEFFPPERRNLEYTVAAHARFGGTTIYYPGSMLYMEKA